MATYLWLNRQVYPTEEDKWYLIVSWLQEETAGPWAIALVKIAISANNYNYNFTTLIDLIAKQFRVHDITKDATTNIQIFRQRESESIHFFNNWFITNASLSGIQEDAALIQFYLQAIWKEIRDLLHLISPFPATLADLIEHTA